MVCNQLYQMYVEPDYNILYFTSFIFVVMTNCDVVT